MVSPFCLKTCNGSHCPKNGVQTEKNVFHQWNRHFWRTLLFWSRVFLKFPAPIDVSFSYDFLLYFDDSEVHFSPYVSPVLYCFLMTSEHALLIQFVRTHIYITIEYGEGLFTQQVLSMLDIK